ncbi:N-acetylmuramoyl-L-alanine amidase [Pseudomonas sp. NPDC090202]|uniref:N-acetylmuramoyl-L-alanine amidase n=1 Tax=unclassified Pseudomonas TaxID=196821 RepID=UPI00381AF2C7
MPDATDYYFNLPTDKRPDCSALTEEMHKDYSWLNQNCSRPRGRDALDIVDTLVIHCTAGDSTPYALDAWRRKEVSAHWIVPGKNEPQHGQFIWATLAEVNAALQVRDVIDVRKTVLGEGPVVNDRSLGIEIVNTQENDDYRDPFSDWQVVATARVVLYAWAKYPNLRHVVSHAHLDPVRRGDPGSQFPWPVFKEMVLSHSALPNPPLLRLRRWIWKWTSKTDTAHLERH